MLVLRVDGLTPRCDNTHTLPFISPGPRFHYGPHQRHRMSPGLIDCRSLLFTRFSVCLSAVTADWSDHALWWPDKQLWLKKPKLTLNQYGVHADTKLQFTPMHKSVRVQLPDLQLLDLKIDFSVSVFNAIIQLCKEMGTYNAVESLTMCLFASCLFVSCLIASLLVAYLPVACLPGACLCWSGGLVKN